MQVRLWTLGDIEKCIFPSKASIDLLRKMISELKPEDDDTVDFVWGPELTLQTFDVNLIQDCTIRLKCPENMAEHIKEKFSQAIEKHISKNITEAINKLIPGR